MVVAHDRPDYVREAVRSVAAQSLDPAQFEIVLLSNVPNLGLGPGFDTGHASQLELARGNWGEWVLSALPHFRGELLCFLDDDDLFEPGKLASVRSTFEQHPSVGYYHNRITRFVEGERPPSRPPAGAREGPIGPDVGLVRTAQKSRSMVDQLFWNAGGFNASAMVVRREVFASLGSLAIELEVGHPLALFYAAAMGPWDLFFDPAPLTRYRVHARNRSVPAGSDLRSEWRRAAENGPAIFRDSERIARFIDSDARHRFSSAPVRSVGTRARILWELALPHPSRWTLLRALGDYLALTPHRSMFDNRGMLGLAGAGVISPRLPRLLLDR